MGGAIIVAIITAGLALTGSVISIIVSTKNADKDLYTRTVSSNRYEWMQNLRQNISDLVEYCKAADNELYVDKNRKTFAYYRAIILLKLNPYADKAGAQTALSGLIQENSFFDLKNKTEQLVEHGRKLLKAEWERYKAEIGETAMKKLRINKRREQIKKIKGYELSRSSFGHKMLIAIIISGAIFFASIGICLLVQALNLHTPRFIWMTWAASVLTSLPIFLGVCLVIKFKK